MLCGQPSAAATVRAGLQSGQLPTAGGDAASGASLDTDDVAGEIDQDRGEGRAPFPEDSLPDGGSGGSARVVPGHSGRDWAAEIGNGDIRMKAERVQKCRGTPGAAEAVSLHSDGKACWRSKMVSAEPRNRKNGAWKLKDDEKYLH